VGVALALAIIVVAFVVDADYGIPLLILAAICVIAAVGFRMVAGGNRSDADSTDSTIRQPATDERPLGDTPEAHDEISPHDLPLDNPGRQAAEEMSHGAEGSTAGHEEGGASGAGGSGGDQPVGEDEAKRGAQVSE
jgi:hypothetical protein